MGAWLCAFGPDADHRLCTFQLPLRSHDRDHYTTPPPQPQTLSAEQASNKHLSLFPPHRYHPGELYLTFSHAPIYRKHTQPSNSSYVVVSVVLVTPGLAGSLAWLCNFSRRSNVFPGGRDPSMLQVLGTPRTQWSISVHQLCAIPQEDYKGQDLSPIPQAQHE